MNLVLLNSPKWENRAPDEIVGSLLRNVSSTKDGNLLLVINEANQCNSRRPPFVFNISGHKSEPDSVLEFCKILCFQVRYTKVVDVILSEMNAMSEFQHDSNARMKQFEDVSPWRCGFALVFPLNRCKHE